MQNKRGGKRPNAGRKKDERYKLTITLIKDLKTTHKSFRDIKGVFDYIQKLGL